MPWNQKFSRLPPGGQTDYELNIRVVRLQLKDGTWECLATNLDEQEFPPEKLAEMYHMRWREETGFGKLKYTVDLLSFKSRKQANLEREIYGRMALFNLNALLILLTERQLESNIRRKHEYQPCFATALTNLREFFRQRISGEEVQSRIKKYLVAVRPDRKVARKHQQKSVVPFNYRAA